ncbi:MAG: N-acetyl-gamma-glutamyl-phosphate reductase [Gammaproteobacteria bacterium]|nr:N-acetyl-gamma-glutamyl-phosphate reductase [Gammaproteobacteria bacterium]
MSTIAIVGATGFTGIELVKLLENHPKINQIDLFSFSNAGKKIKDFSNDIETEDILKDFATINYNDYSLVFFACPNGTVMNAYSDFKNSKTKVIDLAADYRLDNEEVWEKYYGLKHKSPEILSEIVYGLTELNRNKIKDAKIVANPGCYPTAAIISLFPLLKEKLINENSIIIDAKSGFSGAGRNKIEAGLDKKINNNFIPYNFYKHRHKPEISQELNKASGNDVKITFSPHILPIYRGILETIYVDLNDDMLHVEIINLYNEFYKTDSFVKVSESEFSEIKNVINTNNVNLSFHVGQDKKLTIVAVIDNLLKGAAGQAVQNMNVMMGFEETTSLIK